jgi:hypothetical protein
MSAMAPAAGQALRARLKPADPFDLIRLLARSQNDPRKAVAELVQNSLDAGATEISVLRRRKSGVVSLSVFDNGGGVLPDRGRREALQFLATNIGHSIKRRLTAQERLKLMQLGQYGIGLLGFWSVGRLLSLRTRVAGSDVWAMRLEEDKPDVLIEPERGQKNLLPTWTEAVIRDLHPAAQRILTGRKLADYLAFELRGQLLGRETRLRVVDKLARGGAPQDFPIRPPRYQGVLLREIKEWPVEGQPSLRVELLYLPEEHGTGRVALSCAGATVADDLTLLEAGDLTYAPWDRGRLTGAIDAPFLDVAPGTRRGIVPNLKAEAFLAAMRSLADRVAAWLAQFERARSREADQALHRRLLQVFKDLGRKLPHVELFPVAGGNGHASSEGAMPGEAAANAEPEVAASDEPELPFIPPGPLESVRIVPASCRVQRGSTRLLQARPADASGRRVREGVAIRWRMAAGPGWIDETEGPNTVYNTDEPGLAKLEVEASQGDRTARATASVEVVEELEPAAREDLGIPEPVEVKDAAGSWRSRIREGRWEFNGSHPDYLVMAADPAKRFRYLATLLAKELVVRQVAGGPNEDRLLESLIQILAAIEERLGRPGKK